MNHKANKRLEEIDKKQVFTVPDGYFDNLPSQIQQKIQGRVHRKPVFAFSWLKYGVSLAAVCVVMWIGYLFYQPTKPTQIQAENVLADVSNEEIISYLQQSDVSQSELVERISQANLELNNGLLNESDVSDELLLEEADTFLIEDFI